MIKLVNVTKKFPNSVTALDNVSLEFQEGKFYAIMGPSGSGKSTILNIIGGIDNIFEGEVWINESNISEMNEKERAELRMKNFGYIFQSFYLNPYLNAVDNVMMPMEINKKLKGNEKKKKAIELLENVGLKERLKHYPKQMSGGEQQRTAIARALANYDSLSDTSFVVLADEPTGNLDEENEQQVFSLLRSMVDEGKTVIAVSHNETIKNYADIVINIKKGRLENA